MFVPTLGLSLLLLLTAWATLASGGPPPPQLERSVGSVLRKRQETGLSKKNTVFAAEPKYLLPEAVWPTSYEISVIPIIPINGQVPPDFREWSAPGSVKITVECKAPTSVITLSVSNITLPTDPANAKVQVRVPGQTTNLVLTTAEDKDEEYFHLTLSQPLTVNSTYEIIIEDYVAEIPLSYRGLYRAVYTNDAGEERWLATTQFETVGFRSMVPGFDEPKFKATFTLTIGRSPDYNSASNTPIDQVGAADTTGKLPPNWVWDIYKPTLKMSSYLVALVVSDFTHEAADPNILGKPVGIYGPPPLISKQGGVFAANSSAHLLKAFEGLLDVPYALDKMDSVGLPRNYFQFGAMENWGLNIYRDNLLLYYNGESQESNRYQILSILSHELAHQWFGNLITCKWWSHIFLNEGFATYFSYEGVEVTNPEYDARRASLYDAVQVAMAFDVSAGSHPVINSGERSEVEAMSIFDDISYEKGASLIRMMEGFLGKDVLFNGLKEYLAEMEYQAADETNLFSNLQKVVGDALPAGKTMESVMETWTRQKGFPLIRVRRQNSSRILISQERFRLNNNDVRELDPDDLWEVPVAITTQEGADFSDLKPKLWINKDVILMPHDGIDATKWLIVNPGGYGYYRVIYDQPLARLILAQLEQDHTVIDGLTKAKLIDDYFTAAEQELVPFETALEFTKFIGNTDDHVVWMTVISAMNKIVTTAFSSRAGLEKLQDYLTPRVGGALEMLGAVQGADEHGISVLLRTQLFNWACALSHPACSETANTYFTTWAANTTLNPIPLDLQPVIYCAAVTANASAFDFVYQRYLEVKDKVDEFSQTQASRFARALSCSSNFEQLARLVRSALPGSANPVELSQSHITTVLSGVGTQAAGRDLAYGFVRDNWENLAGAIGAQSVATILSQFSTYQNTAGDEDNHDNLIESIKGNPSIYEPIAASLNATRSRIHSNVLWTDKHLSSLSGWLTANV